MWHLYLDESGDLGFDFVNKKPSKHFTITIVAIRGNQDNRKVINAVKKTLSRKLNHNKSKRRIVTELKGTKTTLEVKKYLMGQIDDIPFEIYSLTIDKRKAYEQLRKEKDRIYNYIARNIFDKIPFENANTRVYLSVDRSKSKHEVAEFNSYIERHIQARLHPSVPLHIAHKDSCEVNGLQVADLFSWGIFQKYERTKLDWYDEFKNHIKEDYQFF